MDRVNDIWKNRIRIAKQADIDRAEEDRVFCKHDLAHLLDVARLAYIEALEKGIEVAGKPIKKDLIYACALLHDLGRAEQYESGLDHDLAGVEIAKEVLVQSKFKQDERDAILEAIGGHRSHGKAQADQVYQERPADQADQVNQERRVAQAYQEVQSEASDQADQAGQSENLQQADLANTLARLIKNADHLSRTCFECPAADQCYWDQDRKNKKIKA